MITSQAPDTWRDLQNAVASLLSECGFTVEVEKSMRLVRGNAEIDVFGVEEIDGRRYSIVCECKHWRTRVPQSEVHALRAVMGDLGANAGFFISTAGFQSGAFEAAENTNLRLFTWQEFQESFERSWYERHFYPQITQRLDRLCTYCEPVTPHFFSALSVSEQDQFMSLNEKYGEFGMLVFLKLTTWCRDARYLPPSASPNLPFVNSLPNGSKVSDVVPSELLTVETPREFMEILFAFGDDLISQFEAINPAIVSG